jgi:hypothetical protein
MNEMKRNETMTNRQIAIIKAKDAYRLWVTRAIKAKGFIVPSNEYRYLFECDNGYDVLLNDCGSLWAAINRNKM